MAKDPAVLFYTNDFLTGTFTMTNEQVGKYIRLLCLQHQKGKLSEKDMLSICKAYDEDVYSKFSNQNGFFFNERMKNESDRRKKYSDSRKRNAETIKNQTNKPKNKSEAYAKHMETETETITEIEDTTVIENFLVPEMQKIFKSHNPNYKQNKERDFAPLLSIAKFLAGQGELNGTIEENKSKILVAWGPVCKIIKEDKFYSTKPLSTISKQIQEITQIALHGKSNGKPEYGSAERAKEYDRLFAERYGNG